jgi:hypothetical protein
MPTLLFLLLAALFLLQLGRSTTPSAERTRPHGSSWTGVGALVLSGARAVPRLGDQRTFRG